MVIAAPIKPSSLGDSRIVDELMAQESRWNDAGLTAEDLAEWLAPGLPAVLECDALEALEFKPAK